MPHFYFHICNGTGFTEDEEGKELPDLDAARAYAIKNARDVMAGDIQRGILDLSSFIEIEDEAKQLKATVCFGEAVDQTQHHQTG